MTTPLISEYKLKRTNYLNSYPKCEPFPAEQNYAMAYKKMAESSIVFKPFPMEARVGEIYNITMTFIIDALEMLPTKPNYSFEFLFKGYDAYTKSLDYLQKIMGDEISKITQRNVTLISHKFAILFISHPDLKQAFSELLFKTIPLKSCQYLYLQLFSSEIMNRVTRDYYCYDKPPLSTKSTNKKPYIPVIHNKKRSYLLDYITKKYGYCFSDYNNTIRKGSRLLYRVLSQNSVLIDDISMDVQMTDKLHLLVSGYLYSLRNDIMHGTGYTSTKSSTTHMHTFASSYYAFLLLYYLLMVIIMDDLYEEEADYPGLIANMEYNVAQYKVLFGHWIAK